MIATENYQQRLQDIFGDRFIAGVQCEKHPIGTPILLADWMREVENGGFVDYDGHGRFAWQRFDGAWVQSNLMLKPSDITFWKITPPTWATYVIWCNR